MPRRYPRRARRAHGQRGRSEDRHLQRGLGLYQGIPLLTHCDCRYAGMVMPDRITIYRPPICAMCADEAAVVEQSASPSSTRSPTTSASTTTASTSLGYG